MFNLGQEIYYADPKEGVRTAVVLGYSVNEQGHDVYSLKVGEGYVVIFASLCFENPQDAENEVRRIVPLNNKIKELSTKCNEEIDALLAEIHGKPKFEHLTLKAEKPEQ